MEKPNNIELIEAYYDGRLSPEERVEFELRLVYDTELEEEFQVYKNLRSGFNKMKAEQLRTQLKRFDDRIDKGGPSGFSSNRIFFFIGLAACLVIAFFIFRPDSKGKEFDRDWIPMEAGLPVLMGAESKLDFQNAMTAFKAREYETASTGFLKVLQDFPENDTCQFFLGASLLNEGRYKDAVLAFKELYLQTQSIYFEKSQYYLALAWWGHGNYEETKRMLQEIVRSDNHPFADKSKSLLEKLD